MRRIPRTDNHRSNVCTRGSIAKHTLTKTEKVLCKQINPKLVKDGLYFVGIDAIGGKLVEVNLMSSSGITYMNKAYKNKVKIQERVTDFIESKVVDKLLAFDRCSHLKKRLRNLIKKNRKLSVFS